MNFPRDQGGRVTKAEETPCPRCGELSLKIEWKLHAKPLGSFSVAGQQMKLVCQEWPYLVCKSCGVEAPAKAKETA